MKRLNAHAQRSVVSIAIALEAAAAQVPIIQEDLFGGPIVLTPSAYSTYYAELARRVCARELNSRQVRS